MATPVIGFGAGGHARVVLEAVLTDPRWDVVGLLDADPALAGRDVLGVPVLGGDERLDDIVARGVCHFFIGVGSVGDASTRRRLYARATERGLAPVDAVHPRATISRSASLGIGVTVLAHAVINAGARVGSNVIINTGAIVEHDCIVGDHAHVATGACLGSGVRVGMAAHVGAGATVRQRVEIGEGAVVGVGGAVVDDVPPFMVVVGVPARVLRRVRDGVLR